MDVTSATVNLPGVCIKNTQKSNLHKYVHEYNIITNFSLHSHPNGTLVNNHISNMLTTKMGFTNFITQNQQTGHLFSGLSPWLIIYLLTCLLTLEYWLFIPLRNSWKHNPFCRGVSSWSRNCSWALVACVVSWPCLPWEQVILEWREVGCSETFLNKVRRLPL